MENQRYFPCSPIDSHDIGKCFYCGLEAEEQFKDHVPPERYLAFLPSLKLDHEPCTVPCCKECCELLAKCSETRLGDRMEHLNTQIAKRYREALTIYERWNERELADVEDSLGRSLKAGIELGKEAYLRIKFRGFPYELNGKSYRKESEPDVSFEVFGEVFISFRDALQFASEAYKINIDVLKKRLATTKSFDEAIREHNAEIVAKLEEEKRDKLCAQFARTHRLNKGFVRRSLNAYEAENPDLSPGECLSKFQRERLG